MTRAAAQPWPQHAAMEPGTPTQEWPPLICMASAPRHIQEPQLQHQKQLEYLPWLWRPTGI